MDTTKVIYVTFLPDVACQKLLNSANVSRSYSQNNTGTVFLRQNTHITVHYLNLTIHVPVLLYTVTAETFQHSYNRVTGL